MPRYFFHRRSASSHVEDLEGQDLSNLKDARDEAIEAARELMSEDVRKGIAPDDSQFEIADEQGNVLAIVAFQSALEHK
ncbi:MAG: hypothetical protein JWO28_2757 [Hyphomicrobiales bacterium]|jgi:hypothetical protein|nr:hypothetical protein [Hyphomicrobiales bacterium]